MAALLEAITVKRKMVFEFEGTPYYCLEAEISTPTARGGQTLVRLKMRNLLTRAVFDKTFKAGEKFKEPDLELVESSYLYSDGDGSYFLDQQSFETHTLSPTMVGDAMDFLVEGSLIQLHKFNGNPIGLQLPAQVDSRLPTLSPEHAATHRATSPSSPVSKPAWRLRFLSSSKRARRSRCTQKPGSSPAALECP